MGSTAFPPDFTHRSCYNLGGSTVRGDLSTV
jgi:hypothetical protein